MSGRKPLLAAFDFDWTVIDDDSDHWVVNKLSANASEKMKEVNLAHLHNHCILNATVLIAQGALLGQLHSEGVLKADIIGKLSDIPFNPAMISVFETIKSAGGDIIIISDANTVFIEEILKAKNARHYVSEIITNPGWWDETGKLNVRRRVGEGDEPHGCQSICAVNLCKGKEMMERISQYEMFIYGGDGRNDYCPMTKLSRQVYQKGLFFSSPQKNRRSVPKAWA
ncbi:hypothetical protein HDU67_003729 [Dinochytrium kinnereticum]|nr:hypothetical protein HDU67_003729 [Dinochytrium kinnereticum]